MSYDPDTALAAWAKESRYHVADQHAQPLRDRPGRTHHLPRDPVQRDIAGRLHRARKGRRSGGGGVVSAVTADARQQLIDLYCAAIAGADAESLTANAVA